MEGAPARFFMHEIYPDPRATQPFTPRPCGIAKYVEANFNTRLGRPRFSIRSALQWFTGLHRTRRFERIIEHVGQTAPRAPHLAEGIYEYARTLRARR